MSRTLVLSACSARKSAAGPRVDDVLREVVVTDTRSAARTWTDALSLERSFIPARDLYAGRSFKLCRDIAGKIGADLAIASAGVGLVEASTRIPGYDCTLGGGPSPRRNVDVFLERAWWEELCAGPFSIGDPKGFLKRYETILAVLPAAYLPMIEIDLLDAADAFVDVKVFGGTPRRSKLHRLTVPRPDDLRMTKDGPRSDEGARRLLHHCRHLIVETRT